MKLLFSWQALIVEEYRQYLDELALLGCEIKALSPQASSLDCSQLKRIENRIVTPTYEINSYNTVFMGHIRAFFTPDVFKIYKVLNDFKPDVFHIIQEPFSLIAWELINISKLIHPQPKIVLESAENQYFRQYYPYRFFEKSNLSDTDALITVPLEGKEVWKWKGYKKEVHQCYLGYNSQLFFDRKLEKKMPVKICYVGRMLEEKGIRILMDVFNQLSLKHDIELHLLGDGPIRKNIIDENTNSRIRFHEPVNNSAVPDFLSQMDILVLPTQTTKTCKEQFGRVLTEAMACGVVVVGSSSGEIPNVIRDAGLVFQENKKEELCSALEKLVTNKTLRLEFAAKGEKRALANFTWKTVAKRTKEIYESVLV